MEDSYEPRFIFGKEIGPIISITENPMRRSFIWTGMLFAATLVFGLSTANASEGGKWSGIRGADRDAISTETGLLPSWPEGGPTKLWSLEGIGTGYSSVSIEGDWLYTMGDIGDDQMVFGISLANQKIVWKTKIGPKHEDGYGGPRCVPTIDGNAIYVEGTEGDIACLNRETGKIVWSLNMPNDFGGKMMSGWKFSESPTVDGNLCVFTPGVEKALMVAVDKKTGKTVWVCDAGGVNFGEKGGDGAGYSSIVVAKLAGTRQYVQFFGRGLIGVNAKTGKLLWFNNTAANGVANISFPVIDGNRVFGSAAYNSGSVMVEIVKNGANFEAKELWTLGARDYSNHHGGSILIDGVIYGGDGQNKGNPTAIDAATGKLLWKERRAPANGSSCYLYADGRFYIRFQDHTMMLAELTPDGFKEVSRFTPEFTDNEAWAYPVIVKGKLYLRTENVLECYDIAQ